MRATRIQMLAQSRSSLVVTLIMMTLPDCPKKLLKVLLMDLNRVTIPIIVPMMRSAWLTYTSSLKRPISIRSPFIWAGFRLWGAWEIGYLPCRPFSLAHLYYDTRIQVQNACFLLFTHMSVHTENVSVELASTGSDTLSLVSGIYFADHSPSSWVVCFVLLTIHKWTSFQSIK